MKAPPFVYHAPHATQEAIDLLASCDNARVLAGGQSLMPMMNLRLASPDHLIDLGRIPELVGIEERTDVIAIKAMTSQRAIEQSEVARLRVPLLCLAVDCVGHQQTRNRGTLGGSLCHLDPGAELPVVAAALDAVMVAQGPKGQRRIAFTEFPSAYLTNSLEPDEILVEVEFPKAGLHSGAAFLEFNLRPADFAVVSVAVCVTLSQGPKTIETLAIAVGGIQFAPVRLRGIESVMTDDVFDDRRLRSALTALADLDVDGDELHPPEFRRELCAVLIERAVKIAIRRARAAQ